MNLSNVYCLAGVRLLDCVTVKGSIEPIKLYTFDCRRSQSACSVSLKEYRKMFEEAVDSYFKGNWPEAVAAFQRCLVVKPEDTPASVLIDVMQKEGGVAPANWPGYRVLHDK